MRKKRYLYNIAYFHANGNGGSQIIRDNKINSLEEFIAVRRFIESTNDLKNVVIINYQLIAVYRE